MVRGSEVKNVIVHISEKKQNAMKCRELISFFKKENGHDQELAAGQNIMAQPWKNNP